MLPLVLLLAPPGFARDLDSEDLATLSLYHQHCPYLGVVEIVGMQGPAIIKVQETRNFKGVPPKFLLDVGAPMRKAWLLGATLLLCTELPGESGRVPAVTPSADPVLEAVFRKTSEGLIRSNRAGYPPIRDFHAGRPNPVAQTCAEVEAPVQVEGLEFTLSDTVCESDLSEALSFDGVVSALGAM